MLKVTIHTFIFLFLLSGVLLEEFEEMEKHSGQSGIPLSQLPQAERQFVEASRRDQKMKKRRNRAILLTISGALLVRPLPQMAPMVAVLSFLRVTAFGLAKGAE